MSTYEAPEISVRFDMQHKIDTSGGTIDRKTNTQFGVKIKACITEFEMNETIRGYETILEAKSEVYRIMVAWVKHFDYSRKRMRSTHLAQISPEARII